MSKTSVLVIDSDPTTETIVRAEVDESRAEAVVVDNVQDAHAYCKKRKPSLIVLNVDLPKGWRLCTEFKKSKKFRQVPLVVISSKASDDIFQQHMNLPTRADAYQSKPLDQDTLSLTFIGLLDYELGDPIDAAAADADAADDVLDFELDFDIEVQPDEDAPAPAPPPEDLINLDELRTRIGELEGALKVERDGVEARLRGQAETGKKNVMAAQNERDEARAKSFSLDAEIAELRNAAVERDEARAKIAALERDLETSTLAAAAAGDTATQAAELSRQVEELRSEKEALVVERDAVAEKGRTATTDVDSLKQEVQSLTSQRDAFQRAADEAASAAVTAANAAEEAAAAQQSASGDVAAATQAAEEAKANMRAAEEKATAAEATAAEAEAKATEAEAKAAEAEAKAAEAEAKAEAGGTSAAEAEDKAKEAEDKAAAAEAKFEESEARRVAAESAGSSTSEALAAAERKASTGQGRVIELEAAKATVEGQLKAAKESEAQLRAHSSGVESRYNDAVKNAQHTDERLREALAMYQNREGALMKRADAAIAQVAQLRETLVNAGGVLKTAIDAPAPAEIEIPAAPDGVPAPTKYDGLPEAPEPVAAPAAVEPKAPEATEGAPTEPEIVVEAEPDAPALPPLPPGEVVADVVIENTLFTDEDDLVEIEPFQGDN